MDILWLGIQPNYPSPDDYSGRYKALWDETGLYLLFDITDDVIYDGVRQPLDKYWRDDTVELFIDENNSGGSHTGQNFANAWAYHISIYNENVDEIRNANQVIDGHVITQRISEAVSYTHLTLPTTPYV